MTVFFQFLYYLLLTIILEQVIFTIFGYRELKFIYIQILINTITNLSLNLLVALVGPSLANPYFLIIPLEVAIIAIEGTLYYLSYAKDKKLLLSVATANTFSFLVGIVITSLPLWLK